MILPFDNVKTCAVKDPEQFTLLLKEIVPFRFLSVQTCIKLSTISTESELSPETVITHQNNKDDKRVFIIREGRIGVFDRTTKDLNPLHTIGAGHYFGERSAIFGINRKYEYRCLDTCRLYVISGQEFLKIIRENRAVAMSLATILRVKEGIFSAFDVFESELVRGIANGYINLGLLVPLYRKLQPALHQYADDDFLLDTTALAYAAKRLPDNITQTFSFLLADELPREYIHPDHLFTPIQSRARRRKTWQVLPGQDLILLRHGVTDIFDFVTNLCAYIIEARKLRKRITSNDNIFTLKKMLQNPDSEEDLTIFLGTLNFSQKEVHSILDLWKSRATRNLLELVLHKEFINIEIKHHTSNYEARANELWTTQIGLATKELSGYDPVDLPEDVHVHIISSNTHSVTNCLNPFLYSKKESILEWARKKNHHYITKTWSNDMDLVYALSREYMEETSAEIANNVNGINAVRKVSRTLSTGIQVQLIDVTQLSGQLLEPGLGPVPIDKKILIVNIDYAFGEQAQEIIRNLIMLFGKRLGSINILGKAGAVTGKRGDILVPNAFIDQVTDNFQPVPRDDIANVRNRLQKTAPNTQIHNGPMLTVKGTLLQNREMLHFYRNIWNCIGLEMEGMYYLKEIQQSFELNVLDPCTSIRFFYYVSDLPLDKEKSLSRNMSAEEGLPPLYTITRFILNDIFHSTC